MVMSKERPMSTTSGPTAASYLRRWRRWISSAIFKQNTQTDIRFLDVEQLTRDVDAAMADMPLLIRPNAGPESLMPTRLDLLGLDPGYLRVARPDTYEALQLACVTCPSWRACARDLARGNATRGLGGYCLNAARIDALIAEH
jgi:hypothetical protein